MPKITTSHCDDCRLSFCLWSFLKYCNVLEHLRVLGIGRFLARGTTWSAWATLWRCWDFRLCLWDWPCLSPAGDSGLHGHSRTATRARLLAYGHSRAAVPGNRKRRGLAASGAVEYLPCAWLSDAQLGYRAAVATQPMQAAPARASRANPAMVATIFTSSFGMSETLLLSCHAHLTGAEHEPYRFVVTDRTPRRKESRS